MKKRNRFLSSYVRIWAQYYKNSDYSSAWAHTYRTSMMVTATDNLCGISVTQIPLALVPQVILFSGMTVGNIQNETRY